MPLIGGTKGRAPVAMTILRVVIVIPLTSTVYGEVIFASPCTTLTPSWL